MFSRKKKELIPFVQELVHLETMILAGELTLNGLGDYFNEDFQKYAISLLMRNVKYEVLSDVLYNFVSSVDLLPHIYLKHVIFIRYILEERKGHHIDMIQILLMSYFGVEFIKYFPLEWFKVEAMLEKDISHDS